MTCVSLRDVHPRLLISPGNVSLSFTLEEQVLFPAAHRHLGSSPMKPHCFLLHPD